MKNLLIISFIILSVIFGSFAASAQELKDDYGFANVEVGGDTVKLAYVKYGVDSVFFCVVDSVQETFGKTLVQGYNFQLVTPDSTIRATNMLMQIKMIEQYGYLEHKKKNSSYPRPKINIEDF